MSLLEMIQARRAELEALEAQREEMAGAEFRASLTDEDRARALAAFLAKIDMSTGGETAIAPLDERDAERARFLANFLERFPAVFAAKQPEPASGDDRPEEPGDRPEEPGDFQTEPIFTSELEPWRPTSTVGATTEGQLPPIEMPPAADPWPAKLSDGGTQFWSVDPVTSAIPMPPEDDPDVVAQRDPRYKLLPRLQVEMHGAAKALELACLPLDFTQARYEMRRRRADSVVADRYAAQRRAANDPEAREGTRWMTR
jgi:hypothetical protein